MIRNEEMWRDIEDHKAFGNEKTWVYLEKLQNGGRLTQIDLINLLGLIEEVYKAGFEEGREYERED
jgi:hypothetical protein